VTAGEWDRATDPDELLDYHTMKRDPRRLRLLAAACARRMWQHIGAHLRDPAFRQAIEVVERYADGDADRAEFVAVRKPLRLASRGLAGVRAGSVKVALSVLDCLTHDAMEGMTAAIANAQQVARAKAREGKAQCGLLRCVFANPFRSRVAFSPEALAHNGGAAVKLATVLAGERDPVSGELDTARLAILADALEEAGVDDEAALAHLRGPGPHCRGCHVLDAVLGRTGAEGDRGP
jgi:hypothetical protein